MMNASMEEGPKFFRILVHQDIPEPKMLIPTKYTMEHCDVLSNSVTFELPNGDAWLVELVRDDARRRVWFGNGWQQFSQHYHFQHGHFLLFQLVTTSRFLVLIFDSSAAEIDYSEFTIRVPDEKLSTSLGKQETRKNMEKSKGKATARDTGGEKLSGSSSRAPPTVKAAGTNSVPSWRPSFTKVIPKLYTLDGSPLARLNVPANFVRTHLPITPGGTTMKLNVRGESWPVKLLTYGSTKSSQLSMGWWKFVKDNSLKEGDICTFEQRSTRNEFDVQILRC